MSSDGSLSVATFSNDNSSHQRSGLVSRPTTAHKPIGHPHHLSGVHDSAFESNEARWRRLSPWAGWWSPYNARTADVPPHPKAKANGGGPMPCQCNPVPAHATRTLEPARSTVPAKHRGLYSRAAKALGNRADAPVVRNLRRGTIADALAALRDAGVTALVEDLLKDRYAQSAEASNASLLTTWAPSYAEAFRRNVDDATCSEPMLPLTVSPSL